ELAIRHVERKVVDRGHLAEPLGDRAQGKCRHDQTTFARLTKRSVTSSAVPTRRICSDDTAATVGSIFHSRYCRTAIGKVIWPGAIRNSDTSMLPKLTTKLNSAAATTPGQISGSVTL